MLGYGELAIKARMTSLDQSFESMQQVEILRLLTQRRSHKGGLACSNKRNVVNSFGIDTGETK